MRDVMRVRERQSSESDWESEARVSIFVWESDPIPIAKSNDAVLKKKKKKGELSPDRCRLSLETNEPCELPKLVTVHRTRRSDRSPYESLLFLHGTVLDVKQTVEMVGSRFSQLDCTVRSEFQNYDCASWILIKRS